MSAESLATRNIDHLKTSKNKGVAATPPKLPKKDPREMTASQIRQCLKISRMKQDRSTPHGQILGCQIRRASEIDPNTEVKIISFVDNPKTVKKAKDPKPAVKTPKLTYEQRAGNVSVLAELCKYNPAAGSLISQVEELVEGGVLCV